jgi:glycine/D-amino acid oxidase-like deaminating enzyme
MLRVSASEEEAEHVRRHVEALNADGFPGELVDLPEALRRSFVNGCLIEDDGALQPARWIRGLGRAAEQAGARIHEHTEVRGPVSPSEVVTPEGTVRAQHVIVAADGALEALVPGVPVRARRLHMVATEPLPERLVDCPVYARWGLEYFQQPPDGRLLAGGFSDLDGERSYTDRDEGSATVWDRLGRYLAEDLCVRAQITHRWVGTVGFSEDGLPVVGEVGGLYVAGGYSGHGNVIGYLAGQDLADLVAR